MDLVYLDNNATTPLLPQAWEAMQPYFTQHFGNPASSHRAGQGARRALEDARERIAHLLDAHPDEVVFTSGATEANNLAILGLCAEQPGFILSSPIEHPSVTEPLAQLQSRGFRVQHWPVNREGVVQLGPSPGADVEKDLALAVLMLANHETGSLQPVAQLAEWLGGRLPLHCDAAAAIGKIPVSFHQLGAATMTASAHKFHGPKGIGALLVNRCTRLRPLLFGGHQQHGRRPGTESVALAVGMATALEWCVTNMADNLSKGRRLRKMFLDVLRMQAAPLVLNGSEEDGVPYTLNVSFPGLRADVLLMKLDLAGVACSTGSACSSGSLLPSPVLRAMGLPADVLRSALRFSLSPLTSEETVVRASSVICRAVNELRHEIQLS